MKDVRLRELTEKLRSGQDVSPEEADKIFEAVKKSGQNVLSEDISEWLNAAEDALKSGRSGNFITSVPVRPLSGKYGNGILRIRRLLSPEDRIDAAVVINKDVKDAKRPGVEIIKKEILTEINSERLGMIRKILKETFEDCKLYREENFSKFDSLYLTTYLCIRPNFIYLKDDFVEECDNNWGKLQFLAEIGLPIVMLPGDFKNIGWRKDPDVFYYDVVFLKDCDMARKVVSLGKKDIVEIANRQGIERPEVKDVSSILFEYFLSKNCEEIIDEDDSWVDIER